MVATSGLILAAALYYAALCALKPFGTCRKCEGSGKVKRFKTTKTCPRCRGRRLRLRIGRRAWNAWTRTRAAGTK
ncbi:hypothetical protein [Streptomyces sp. NPDC051219]|uniref:hypothetical protein n=1 Tax=Streptomyces sp. NPDC051219 TaxID=3155283 RepID=UPI003439B5F6